MSNKPQFVESDLPGTSVSFIERIGTVPPDCYAVTDGEVWGVYPKKYCRGAKIIKCSVCGRPATHIDPYFPYFTDLNLCDEHWREREDGGEVPKLKAEKRAVRRGGK